MLIALHLAKTRQENANAALHQEIVEQAAEAAEGEPGLAGVQGLRQRGTATETEKGELGGCEDPQEAYRRGQEELTRIEEALARWRSRVWGEKKGA